MQITINMNNLRLLTLIQAINRWWQVQSQNRHPRHELPKTCRVRKSTCPISIRHTDNLQSQRRKKSGSSNTDPLNEINTSQNLKKIDFRSSKTINWFQQVVTLNRIPQHDFPQVYGGRKSLCPIWVFPTEDFQSHLGKSFSINEFWSDKLRQTGQKSTILWWKITLQRTILLNENSW